MFRHILLYCMVVALFMMATDMALSVNTVVNVDFEGHNEGDLCIELQYPPLIIDFETTNPNEPYPYFGVYGDPGYTGWLCNQLNQQDMTIPPPLPPGNTNFLGLSRYGPVFYDLEVRFTPLVDKIEGEMYDTDDDEQLIITAYGQDEITVISSMTLNQFSPTGGGDCGKQHWVVSGPGIRMLRFDGYKSTDNYGTGTDNWIITYTPGQAIPTLTEWGLIIFGLMLLGFISWVFVRRRKVVGVRI